MLESILLEDIAIMLESILLEDIAIRLEAITIRLKAIANRLEAIASRLEAIAIQFEAIASRLEDCSMSKADATPSLMLPGTWLRFIILRKQCKNKDMQPKHEAAYIFCCFL